MVSQYRWSLLHVQSGGNPKKDAFQKNYRKKKIIILVSIIFSLVSQSRFLTTRKKKALENTVGKGKNAGNQHFLQFSALSKKKKIVILVMFVVCKCFQFGHIPKFVLQQDSFLSHRCVGKQPVFCKEYFAEHWLKELQESMDKCTGHHDITEKLLKTALNTIQSIN